MKKTAIILLMILVIFTYFLILRPTFTGNLIEGTPYAYTKAICDQTSCKDYFIECNNKELTNFKFTGNMIENNKHPIELIDKNRLCD